MNERQPIISIITNCKNGMRSIRRCIESVVTQDYCNVEYIVQDGVSTDGTLEILREYEQKYPNRLKLVSEPDSSPEEGFFRALKRCKGEIIGSCLADEELMPGACAWAVEQMTKAPEAGSIYGDMYATDINGNITGTASQPTFDVGKYLCHEINPNFAASFFRRSCLEAIGLQEREWVLNAGEVELWIRLGLNFPIYNIPGFFVTKYAVHKGQLSSTLSIYRNFLRGNIELFNKLYAEPGTLDAFRHIRLRAYASVYLWIGYFICELGDFREARRCISKARKYEPDKERLEILSKMIPSVKQRMKFMWCEAEQLENHGELEHAYNIYLRLSRTKDSMRWLAAYRAGSLARRCGRRNDALREFQRLAGDSTIPDAQRAGAAFHLGELALEERQNFEAAQLFAQALALSPGHHATREHLRKIVNIGHQ
jgi:glycosyltransferase involved in cell wall biosynthesis